MPKDKFNPGKVIALAEPIRDAGKRAAMWAYCDMHDRVDGNRDIMDGKLMELVEYIKIHFPEMEI